MNAYSRKVFNLVFKKSLISAKKSSINDFQFNLFNLFLCSLERGDLTTAFDQLSQMKKYPLSRFNNEILKMSFSLVKLYSQLSRKKEDFQHWKLLCEEILQYLTLVDPGKTKIMATFLLQHNKSKLVLEKINFEEGKLSREDYLQSIKQTVIVENQAQKVLENAE